MGSVPAPVDAAGAPADPVTAPRRYVDEVFAGVTETTGVAYADDLDQPGEVLRLDLFEPTGDTAARRPVVIWAHGGGFTDGVRTSPLIRRQAQSFARRGYVTASISYRLSDAEGPEAIRRAVDDLRAAVRWFRSRADELRIDPERISAGGYSAGAVMALTAAFEARPDVGSNPGWPSQLSAAIAFAGAGLTDGVRGDPPAVMFHGEDDTRVPYDAPFWSGTLSCRVARVLGTDCIFHSYPGVAHGIFDNGPREAAMRAITAHFLSCRVGAAGPYTDVGGATELAAGWAARSGVLDVGGDRRFRPGEAMRRGPLLQVLWRLVGAPAEGFGPHRLRDVPADLAPAARWGVATGVLTRPRDRRLDPREPVRRAEAARMLHAAAGSVPVGDLPRHRLTDVPRSSARAVRWIVAPRPVQLLDGGGIATAFPDRTFRPRRTLTRGLALRWVHGLALAGTAWDAARQAAPPPATCHRLADPPSD